MAMGFGPVSGGAPRVPPSESIPPTGISGLRHRGRMKALWGADTDTREVWKRRKYGCVRESAERAWSTGREPGLGTRDRCGTAVGPRSNGAVWSGLFW